MDAREYKLIFTGPMGAGKTTAIRAVSEIDTISTEVANTDRAAFDKDTTTVAMDYGEVQLAGGSRLRLYGTPGQERFAYMWPILAKGSVGVIVLLDGSRADAVERLTLYVSRFIEVVGPERLVVAVGRLDPAIKPLAEYHRAAQQLGVTVPVVTADVRQREDVQMLLEILFTQVEVAGVLAELGAEV
ncbi:MAG TPA: ATP/GTP-binding protein [Rhodanobacteraceae bacterium]|nr:ATP/GTP-binding protein [Rhodanobacteraceae bacterium]